MANTPLGYLAANGSYNTVRPHDRTLKAEFIILAIEQTNHIHELQNESKTLESCYNFDAKLIHETRITST